MKYIVAIILFFPLSAIAKEKKNEIVKISNHEEFHKLANTGMKVGTDYQVQTYLSKQGNAFVGGGRMFVGYGKEGPLNQFDKKIRFTHDFEPGSDEIKGLYDLREKIGCFVVYMATNELWLKSFKPGPCE